MQALAVIPARYQAQRFPGKPLVLIQDKPMIQWVYQAALSCPDFDRVIVATEDLRIADCVTAFGGEVVLTRADHPTGTDRVAEVAQKLPEYGVIANVQGDQPFATAAMLSALIQPYLVGETPAMTTLCCPLLDTAQDDPNSVKVLVDQTGHALYFSRANIPYRRNPGPVPVYHHLGLYAFRRDFLLQYQTLRPSPLEQAEGLEQLRVLEQGFRIRVCAVPTATLEINTPADLALALERLHGGSHAPDPHQ